MLKGGAAGGLAVHTELHCESELHAGGRSRRPASQGRVCPEDFPSDPDGALGVALMTDFYLAASLCHSVSGCGMGWSGKSRAMNRMV